MGVVPKEACLPSGAATVLKGIPVSEGIAIGKAHILTSPWDEVVSFSLKGRKVEDEVRRYKKALKEVENQLIDCRNRVHREIGTEEAKIFESHLFILNDSFFQEEIVKAIEQQKKNAESTLKDRFQKWIHSFQRLKNEFFKYRLDDIQDVAMRILRVLLQTEEMKFPLTEPAILIAHNLVPSDTARIDSEKVLGFATEMGGKTSHASILARSLGLPAVVGVEKLMQRVKDGDRVILDSNAGILIVDPPGKILQEYVTRKNRYNAYWRKLTEDISLPPVTEDGIEISLQANITISADLRVAVKYKADGVGLFRTELPFLIAGRLLTEDEQFKIYHSVLRIMKGKNVVIRTLDLGGDKFLPFQQIQHEQNPFLGWRSIRIFLQEKDIFKEQLKAILRASHFGPLKILFPMISSLEEVLEINQVLEETKEELRSARIPFDQNIQSGIMIEIPSAAIMADQLIAHTDFFSIGTNDLIQYTLAVDRNNEKVAPFYQPLNPAILQLVRTSVQAAVKAGKSVSMCGEMAGNPLYTAMLIGFGLRQFSMSPLMLLEVRERIRAVSIQECEKLSEKILKLGSTEEIEKILGDFHQSVNPKQTTPLMEKNTNNWRKTSSREKPSGKRS